MTEGTGRKEILHCVGCGQPMSQWPGARENQWFRYAYEREPDMSQSWHWGCYAEFRGIWQPCVAACGVNVTLLGNTGPIPTDQLDQMPDAAPMMDYTSVLDADGRVLGYIHVKCAQYPAGRAAVDKIRKQAKAKARRAD